jgi:hypothetical protein
MTLNKVNEFIATSSRAFADREASELKALRLSDLIGARNLIWLHSQPTGSASDLVKKLIDSRLTAAAESFARSMMEDLGLIAANMDAQGDNQIVAAALQGDLRQSDQSSHPLAGQPEIDSEVLIQLGREARERRIKSSIEIIHAGNRITRELLDGYCTPTFAIDWKKLTTLASGNAA